VASPLRICLPTNFSDFKVKLFCSLIYLQRTKTGNLTPGDALMEVLEPRQTIRPSRYSIKLRPLTPSSPPAQKMIDDQNILLSDTETLAAFTVTLN
jgi:hypothetical protein